jgi:hypothetical protein
VTVWLTADKPFDSADAFDAIEKVDLSGFERVLGAHHEQLTFLDVLLQDARSMPQVIGGRADVGANGMANQSIVVVAKLGGEQRLDGGANAIDDRA